MGERSRGWSQCGKRTMNSLVIATLAASTHGRGFAEASRRRTQQADSSAPVACLTAAECRARSEELGYASFAFISGANLPSRGCFTKGDKAYFAGGGTAEEVSRADLAGLQERLWCDPGGSREQEET